MKRPYLALTCLLLTTCAHALPPPETQPETQPAALPAGVELVGDVYYIPNEGVEVNGESGFRLGPGTYRFATDKAGHRLGIHVIEIDSFDARFIRIEPGPGFAVAEFTFTPEADVVVIADLAAPDVLGRGLRRPWRVDLDAGRYRVEAQAEGRLPLKQEFEVLPGEPVHLDLHFTPNPTSAPLLITSTPAGAELFVDGARVGDAPQNLEAVEFGTHRIRAYLYSDPDNRVVFEADVVFDRDSPRTLELTLDVEQGRFEDEWYERAEAERLRERRAEEEAYREARVRNPVEVQLRLPSLADKAGTTLGDFSRALFMVLRAGDRVRVDLGGTDHLVWKRSYDTSDAFRSQVEALWNDQPIPLDYEADPVTVMRVDPGPSLITSVADRLYRRLNDHPILDLEAAMHDLPGLTLHTVAEDGSTAIVTFGGGNVAVNGRNVPSTRQLGFLRLAAGDRQLDLTWDEAPDRILVVSGRNTPAEPVVPSTELNLGQKHVLELGVGGRVQSFHRFTAQPDGTWLYAAKELVGGLPGAMNIDSDELGPHVASGAYTRAWVIDYETEEGKRATRQVAVEYTVGDVTQPVEAQGFIRRPDR